MSRQATAIEVATILREQSSRFLRVLQLKDAQLSIPVDGKGLRVRVSVRKGERRSDVDSVTWQMDEKQVIIPIEVVEDYEDYYLL